MRRLSSFAALATAISLLSACSVGIKPGDAGAIKETFHVDTPYQETYRRADTFARICHSSNNSVWKPSFNVTGNLYTDQQKGVLHVSPEALATDVERIDIISAPSGGTDVVVTVWGMHQWDQGEVEAAHRSIGSGKPICR